MMNLVALCLILTSIASGGFFSPPSQEKVKNDNHQHEDLVLKEANRVIMVEYERESVPRDHSSHSPPSPSPPEPSALEENLSLERSMASGVMDSAKEKFKEASSLLPNLGQGLGDSPPDENHQQQHHGYNAKDLICDAYGKCKHKLSGVFSKAKEGEEVAKEGLSKAKDRGESAVGRAKETGESAVGSAKEAGESAVGRAKEVGESAIGRAKEIGEAVQGTGKMAMEKTKEGLEKAKEKGREVGEATMGRTREKFEGAKDTVYGTGEKAKEEFEMAKGSVKEKAQEVQENAQDVGEKTMENVKKIGQDLKKGHNAVWDKRSVHTKATGLFNEGTRNFSDVFWKGKDVFIEAAKHSVSREVVSPAMGVVLLYSLASAYGIGMWVTFLSSHLLAQALSNQQFGIVQSKIYPAYFRTLAACFGTAIVAHALRNPSWGLKSLQTYNMFVCLGLVLLNMIVIEPRATKVMFEKMKVEKEEGRGSAGESEELVEPLGGPGPTMTMCTDSIRRESFVMSARTPTQIREEEYARVREQLGSLNRRLRTLNTISSASNVLILMFLSWQLVYLGKGLPVS